MTGNGGRLRFRYGPMGAGKSTLLCQDAHNRRTAGQDGLVVTFGDRAGDGQVSARGGLTQPAVPARPDTDVADLVPRSGGRRFVLVDEAQFASPAQIEAFADAVDTIPLLDITCYGLLSDFTGRLFPGAGRLVELADDVEALQLPVWCWCGQPATMNGRVGHDGALTHDGPTVSVGDVGDSPGAYTVVCRRHHRSRRGHR